MSGGSAGKEAQPTDTGVAGTIHATAVAIGEQGILIRGPSGSGKSRLALALIESGEPRATMIADDRVILTARDGILFASVPETIAGLLEVRGLGIIRRPFASPVAIRLCVDLVSLADAPRMPTEAESTATLEGISVPRVFIAIGAPDAPLRVRVALTERART
jgi:serine kinase of HPr protein (carbohydrate metabolism regulator)